MNRGCRSEVCGALALGPDAGKADRCSDQRRRHCRNYPQVRRKQAGILTKICAVQSGSNSKWCTRKSKSATAGCANAGPARCTAGSRASTSPSPARSTSQPTNRATGQSVPSVRCADRIFGTNFFPTQSKTFLAGQLELPPGLPINCQIFVDEKTDWFDIAQNSPMKTGPYIIFWANAEGFTF